jgi:hypothetical protein
MEIPSSGGLAVTLVKIWHQRTVKVAAQTLTANKKFCSKLQKLSNIILEEIIALRTIQFSYKKL